MFRDSDKRLSSLHNYRIIQVHPATIANKCRSQKPQPLPGAGVHLEDRYLQPCFDSFEVEPRNDSVLGKSEGESVILVERYHRGSTLRSPLRAALSMDAAESCRNCACFNRT